jgi:hypothetical protein
VVAHSRGILRAQPLQRRAPAPTLRREDRPVPKDVLEGTATLPLGPEDVLTLQRTAGNQQVLRRLNHVQTTQPAAPAHVQRKQTGLKQAKQVSDFATDAVAYFKDKGNTDKPLNEFATHLMSKINAELKSLGSREVTFSFDGSGSDSGSFFRVTWNVTINTRKFSSRDGITKVGELTVDEAAEVADTLYHECRHSEQYFRIARMLAGQSTKATVDDIAQEIVDKTSIPKAVALDAAAVPLKQSKADAALLAEAKEWQSITIGIHEDYKGHINDWIDEARAASSLAQGVTDASLDKTRTDLNTQITNWKGAKRGAFVDTHITTVDAIKSKGKMDKLVLKHLKAIKKLLGKISAGWQAVSDGWAKDSRATRVTKITHVAPPLQKLSDEVYSAYRDHMHEKDAWEAGGLAGAAFRKLAKKKK